MSGSRKFYIAGNWKMHMNTIEAVSFVQKLRENIKSLDSADFPDIMLAPSFVTIALLNETIRQLEAPIIVSAQTMESRDSGAYTGEISPAMLQDVGINTVIIGHSERRQYYNETDITVNDKVKAALAHDMTPIFCLGETLDDREGNRTDMVIQEQLITGLEGIAPETLEKVIIAYEPVWAIGTGKTCDAEEANRVCGLIREFISNHGGNSKKVRILYGGSMKPENAEELLASEHIDGGLIGGASLDPEKFANIIETAIKLKTAATASAT